MITAKGLTRRFGNRTVVDQVTFDVARGEIVVLLGPNGAGKTTTMRMLAGLVAPTSGVVTIDGTELTARSGGRLRRRIGFLTEAPGLWDRLTVRENLMVYAELYGIARPGPRVDLLLDDLGLRLHAGARAAELSKGMRQKAAIARTLLHEPDVLLLDEPTSSLDPEVSRGVRRLLQERRGRGCAILLSTHNLDEAERCADRVAVLHRRLLALDAPAALREKLATGCVVVRVGGDAARWMETARQLGFPAVAEGDALSVTVGNMDEQTPRLVRALAGAGAAILEVRSERPALEDVYLHLVGEHP